MVDRRRASPKKHRVTTAGLLVGGATLFAVVPACSSSPTTPDRVGASPSTTATTTAATLPNQNPAEVAACVADSQSLETALAAYLAEHGAYPSPPAPWTAATYAANYAPLTAASGGGPFLHNAP